MPAQVKCPSCSTVLRLPDNFPPGGSVRCPKCATNLRVPGPAATTAPKPAAPTAPPPRPAPPPRLGPESIKPAARKPLPDWIDEEDLDENKPRSRPKAKSNKGLLFGILGCAGLLVLGCGGAVTYGVYRIYSAGKEQVESLNQQITKELDEQQAALKKIQPPADPVLNPPVGNNPIPAPANPILPAGNTLDVSFISDNFNTAVVIHPKRILQSKSPLLPAPDMLDQMLGEALKETGIDLRQLEQVILLIEPFPGGLPGETPLPPQGDGMVGKAFTSPTGKFSVQFPGVPRHTTQKKPGGTTHTYLLELSGGKVAYMVMYNDMPAGALAAGPQFLLDTIAKQFGADLKSKKSIKLDGHPGMELELERKDRGSTVLVTDRIYLVGNRMYQVMTSAAQGSKDPVAFARFLDSFQLRKAGDAPAPPGAPGPVPSSGNVAFFPAGILRFAGPVDGQKVLAKSLNETEPVSVLGRTYQRSKTEKMAQVPMAGFIANERTVLLAPEPTLKKMLVAPNANSPLVARLRTLNLENDASGAMILGPVRRVVAELGKNPDIPPQLAGVKTLDRNLDAVTFTLNVNSEKMLEIVLHAPDEPAANSLEQLARAALDMGKQMYAGVKPELQKQADKELPPDLTPRLLRLADQIEKDGIRVTRQGKEVTVTLAKPKDL